MRPRRLTRWQWVEVIVVALPAMLVVPMAGLAVAAGMAGAAELLTPGAIADLGWGPAMAVAWILWLPLVGMVSYPMLLVAIALGPARIRARPALKWPVLVCGVAGLMAAGALLAQPGGDGLLERAFGIVVFGLPAAIGARYLWLVATGLGVGADRFARSEPEARREPASRPAPSPPAPAWHSARPSLRPLLPIAVVLAGIVVLAAAGVAAWVFRPRPDGIHRSYYQWDAAGFDWGNTERLKSEVPYRDGKRHGVARIYGRGEGALEEERTYDRGRLHGPTRTFSSLHPPGALRSVTMFDRGVRLWTKTYYLEGSLMREVEYTEGEDRGRYVNYDRFGRVIEEGTRRGGWTLESVTTTYAHDGTVRTRTRYRHGEGRTALPVPPGTNESSPD